jgi:hypothetical protein
MRTLDKIKNLLVEQITSYRSLLDLLQRERESLVRLDAGGVEAISKEKDTVIIRLRLIEEERIRLVGKFLAENHLASNLSLQRIVEITGDESLQILRLQLVSLLQSIEELNAFNMVLIGRSLNFIKHSMAFLESFGLDIDQLNTGTIFSREI